MATDKTGLELPPQHRVGQANTDTNKQKVVYTMFVNRYGHIAQVAALLQRFVSPFSEANPSQGPRLDDPPIGRKDRTT